MMNQPIQGVQIELKSVTPTMPYNGGKKRLKHFTIRIFFKNKQNISKTTTDVNQSSQGPMFAPPQSQVPLTMFS